MKLCINEEEKLLLYLEFGVMTENAMSEREKMKAGELYDAGDPELVSERLRARRLLSQLNSSSGDQLPFRREIYEELFGRMGSSLIIEPPFYCDYGSHIEIGDRVFFNFNCVLLDPAPIRIGDDVLFGPAVQIYTATHPVHWQKRRKGLESARPVKIGSDVWVGGGAIINPGVQIGERSVIGSGSVVTRNVPAGVFAAGNPCRPLRELT